MFKQYYKSLSKDGKIALADGCGTSVAYLSQVANDRKQASEALAIKIEGYSQLVGMCEALCPETDWSIVRNSNSEAA